MHIWVIISLCLQTAPIICRTKTLKIGESDNWCKVLNIMKYPENPHWKALSLSKTSGETYDAVKETLLAFVSD